jgi:hypothetical protein
VVAIVCLPKINEKISANLAGKDLISLGKKSSHDQLMAIRFRNLDPAQTYPSFFASLISENLRLQKRTTVLKL